MNGTNLLIGSGVGTAIYTAKLCSIDNMCYRVNDEGIKKWNFSNLWTEGIWGPIRSTRLLLKDGYWKAALIMFCDSANPWFTIPSCMLFSQII